MTYQADEKSLVVQAESDESIDWSAYSKHYDEMCYANPAYLSNIDELIYRVPSWDLPDRPSVLDVGAGTGSFILALSEVIPEGDFTHIDFDRSMSSRARKKYAASGLDVSILEEDVRKATFPQHYFDLAICVNALYSIPEHDQVLNQIRSWTNPGGRLFIIDFGRKVEVLDWAIYILRNKVKDIGLRETLRWYKENSENIKQNKKGAKAQATGSYWLHSTDEFRQSLEAAGWDVDEISTCYRDCCDLAVCTNPLEPESQP